MNLKDIDVSKDPLNYILYIKYLYTNKIFILLFLFVFGFIGIIVSLMTPIEYKSSTIIIPQSASSQQSNYSSLGNLASLAGININDVSSNSEISPNLYPMLIQKLSFQKNIIEKKLNFNDFDEPLSFKEYYQKSKKNPSLLNTFLNFPSYIVELLINKLIKNEKLISLNNSSKDLNIISKEEKEIMDIFESKVSLSLFQVDGYIEISAIMPEAIVASELANNTRIQLQEEIIKIKVKSAQSKLDFLLDRLSEIKKNYDKTRLNLADFKEKNKSINSLYQQNTLDELIAENNLAFTLYSDIQKQIENQRIKVKEETPVFTVIKEPVVPLNRHQPKRKKMVINYMFIGFFLSIFFLLSKPFIIKIYNLILKK